MSIPLPPGLEMRTTMSRNSPVVGLGMRARTTTCSSPRPSVDGRKFAHDVIAIHPRFRLRRRPHVKQYPIPIEALMGRPPRLKQPDAGHRFGEHALQMRQLHDAAGLIAHRG